MQKVNGTLPLHGGAALSLSRLVRCLSATTLSVAALGGASSMAQSSTLSGHLADQAGSIVPRAQVTVTNTATKNETKTEANGAGIYQFPPLMPGEYVLTATAPTFGTVTINHLLIEVGSDRNVDVTLTPASEAQSVTVTATVPELVTDQPDRGNVIESEFVQNIPLNIRNPLQLVNFSVGVTATNKDSGNNDQSQVYTNSFRINGGKTFTTESLLDGGVNTTPYDFNAVAAVPQVDSIQEFKVLTTAYAPEWGLTSGAVVTFATKSGGTRFHGGVFEYLRNSAADSNSFDARGRNVAKPHFERNQFGGTFGGPVALPFGGHFSAPHKTFFFVNYERLQQGTASNVYYTVPTVLERNGDFSQSYVLQGGAPVLDTIYDPSTLRNGVRSAFAGNRITNLDPVGKALLNSYPLPNTQGSNGVDTNNYYSNVPTTSEQNTVGARLDHRFSDKQSIFAHFAWFERFNFFGDPYRNGLSPVANNQRLPGDNVMLDHTWTLSPSLVFEQHFVRVHQESNRTPPSLGFNPTTLGFNSSVVAGLPSTTFPYLRSANRISSIGPSGGLEADGGTTYEYSASVSQLHGKHSPKYGFIYRFESLDYNINQLVTVTATNNFTGGPTASAPTATSGSGIADLLLGAGQVTSGVVPGFRFSHPYFAFYAQDQYRLTPKLTLTYGLRYSIEMPDNEKHNQVQFLDLNTPSPLNTMVTGLGTLTGGPVFTGVNGVGGRVQNAQYGNLDPRFGFAFQVDTKTVLRGGFGIFHAPALINLGAATSQGFSAVTTSLATADNVTPTYNLDNPFPSGLIQPTGSSLGLATNAGFAITGYPRQQKISYSEQWSLDVQRELPGKFVLTAGYVGNNGLHLYAPLNLNQLPDGLFSQGTALTAQVANPFAGTITNSASALSRSTVQRYQLLLPHPQFTTITSDFSSTGASTYHALQLTLERRFSNGFSLLTNYTRSKMIDNIGDYLDFFSGLTYQDYTCPGCDRSVSSQDLTNVLRVAGVYQLPLGSGRAHLTRGPLSAVLGGWNVGSFFSNDSGSPVRVGLQSSASTTNVFGGGTPRPNATGASVAVPGGRHLVHQVGLAATYFNPAAFATSAPFTYGTASRYQSGIRLPGVVDVDVLLEKQMPLYERLKLDFRAEAFNVLNHVQLGGLSSTLNGANFGLILPTQANDPRSLQLSLRLDF